MFASAVATIALILLAASGIGKLVDPDPTSGALKTAGLPSGRAVTRILGAGEVGASLIGLTIGGWTLLPAAILYLGFAVFTLAAVRNRFPLQSCGCFGRTDTPPTTIHIVYNMIALASLLWSALGAESPVPWSAPVGEVLLFLSFAITGAFLSYLLLAQLPQTLKAAQRG